MTAVDLEPPPPATLLGAAKKRPTDATVAQCALLHFADSLPVLRPIPERDSRGRYVLPNPDTGAPAAWTRATTLASTLEETFGVDRWEQRLVGIGLAMRSDLVARIAAVADPHENPGKAAVNDAVYTAMLDAGCEHAADLGTAIHAATEHLDAAIAAGTEPPRPPEPYDADIAAYHRACAAAGIERPAEWIERIVVNADCGAAGTFDRIVTAPTWRLPRIGDVKTQKTMAYGALKIAMQLAIYARASHLWRPDGGGYEPMPAVDTDVAVVFHMPVGAATCVIYEVDIARGWECVQLALQVREWRRAKGLVTELTPAPPIAPAAARTGNVDMGEAASAVDVVGVNPADGPAAVMAAAEVVAQAKLADVPAPLTRTAFICGPGMPGRVDLPVPCGVCGEPALGYESAERGGDLCQRHHDEVIAARDAHADAPPATDTPDAERSEWLMGRFRTLASTPAARAALSRRWPTDVATSPPWTTPEIEALIPLLTDVEADADAPFPAPDPAPPIEEPPAPVDEAPVPPRLWPEPVEGPPVDAATVDALRARIVAAMATEAARHAIAGWSAAAKRNGRPFDVANPSERIAAVSNAVVDCATHLLDDEQPDVLVRAALTVATGIDLQESWETGAVIASLSTEEAQRLSAVATTFAAGDHDMATRLFAIADPEPSQPDTGSNHAADPAA